MAASIILSLLAFCTINKYGEFLSVMRTFQFFPFFVIGSELSHIRDSFFRMKKSVLVVILFLSVAILSYFAGPKLCAIEFHKYGIKGLSQILDKPAYITLFVKYLVDIVALVVSLCVLHLVELQDEIAKYGKNTLFLYVVHVPFYYVIAQFCNNFIISLFLAILFIVIFSKVSSTKYAHYIMYPISSLLKKVL